MTNIARFLFACALAFGLGASASQSHAQSSLQQKIENELAPQKKVLTRSLKPVNNPNADAERKLINTLQTRSIRVEGVQPTTAEERQQIAEIIKDKPKIDLEIFFDYNSAEIGPKAIPAVNALGAALARPDFKGGVFILNGHTDAAGSAEYNQALSERRAQAVRKYLIEKFKLEPKSLLAAGFGKEQLKFPDRPLADENRRVQIVNATQ